MAGFSDFMGAMRFGMGLVSGFTHQAQQERQANETQQLALLKILKDQEHDIVPIDPNEVQQSGGVLGALFGAGGGNTFNIGGRGFKVVRKAPYVAPPSIINSLIPQTQQTEQRTSETFKVNPPQASDILADVPQAAPVIPGAPTTPQNVEQPTSSVLKPIGDTVATRHNNPLNIKLGSLTQKYVDAGVATVGEPATDGGHFLRFVNPQEGFKAAQELLQSPLYANKTVNEALQLWSNRGYGGDIVRGVIDPRLKVQDLTPEQQNTLMLRMSAKEGYSSVQPNIFAGSGATAPLGEAAPPAAILSTPSTPPATAPGLRYVQNTPSTTDIAPIAPSASEPVLPRIAGVKLNTQGLDDEQLSTISATLKTAEAQYRAAEAQITIPRQRQALTAANDVRLVAEYKKLVDDAKRDNLNVVTKERKALAEMYHMPIPVEVRTPSAVAKFHAAMAEKNFDPELHEREVKRVATQKIAEAVQTGDPAKIQAIVPTLTAAMAARHFSKADIDEVKEVGGYKAWEAGQQAATTATARQKAEQPYKNIGTADQQNIRQFVFKKWVDDKRIDPATPINNMPFTFEEDVRKETTKRDIDAEVRKHANTAVPELTLEHLLDPTTLRPLRDKVGITWDELAKLPNKPLAVAPVDQKAIQSLETFKAYANAIQADLNRLTGQGGPFAHVTQDWAGRNASAWAALVQTQTQKDPAFKRLQERLNEWGTKTIAALEGLGSRPAARLLEPALAYRPSMEANLAGRLTGGLVGKIPDTPDQIRAQIEGTLAVADNIVNIILYGKSEQAPAGQTPAAQTPAGQAPAGQAPAGQAPAGQAVAPTKSLLDRMREQAQPQQAP